MGLKGDSDNFDLNWKNRKETHYLHWSAGQPKNQVQLAFRNHWNTFSRLIGPRVSRGKCLEVGCGRGSLSAYFAKNGWKCTLLDLSKNVLERASSAFREIGISDADFIAADCLNMPLPDNEFDVIFSIGLYEHFESIDSVAKEQYRCLKENGMMLAYVVPYKEVDVQKEFDWFNQILKAECSDKLKEGNIKKQIFRSNYKMSNYIELFNKIGLKEVRGSGIYSMPMISYSTEFPFTLLDPESEKILVDRLKKHLSNLKTNENKDPWLCDEDYGHAFLVYGKK